MEPCDNAPFPYAWLYGCFFANRIRLFYIFNFLTYPPDHRWLSSILLAVPASGDCPVCPGGLSSPRTRALPAVPQLRGWKSPVSLAFHIALEFNLVANLVAILVGHLKQSHTSGNNYIQNPCCHSQYNPRRKPD